MIEGIFESAKFTRRIMKKRTLNDMKGRIAMDKILNTMDKAMTKVQKEFHAYVVNRKIKKFKKKVEKKITYVSDWFEAKAS